MAGVPDSAVERFADDVVIHCVTEREAHQVREAFGRRHRAAVASRHACSRACYAGLTWAAMSWKWAMSALLPLSPMMFRYVSYSFVLAQCRDVAGLAEVRFGRGASLLVMGESAGYPSDLSER